MEAQNQMRAEYGQFSDHTTFNTKIRRAAEDGLLLFAKYGLVLLLVYLGVAMVTNVIQGSQNGTSSALYLQQVIEKGYLPKIGQDGQVPVKVEEPNAKNSQ